MTTSPVSSSRHEHFTQYEKSALEACLKSLTGAWQTKKESLIEELKRLINSNKDLINHAYGSSLSTPLHIACQLDDQDFALWLIEQGADVNALDTEKQTPGHFAAAKGHFRIVLKLLSMNLQLISQTNRCGQTLVHVAVSNNQEGLAKMLMGLMTTPTVPPPLEKNISEINRSLFWVCQSESNETSGNTVWAGNLNDHDREELALEFIRGGAELKARDEKGCTPGHYACASGLDKVVNAMLEKDPSLVHETDDSGRTWFHEACDHNQKEIALMLLNSGANPAGKDLKGRSGIHSACAYGMTRIYEKMLNQDGTLVHEKDEGGNTPLHTACAHSEEDIALTLMMHQAKVTEKNSNQELPGHKAAENGLYKVLEVMLLKEPSIIDSQDKNGRTMLFKACKAIQDDAALLLIKKGANARLGNSSGTLPLKFAFRSGRTAVIKAIADKAPSAGNGTYQEGRTYLECSLVNASEKPEWKEIALAFAKGATDLKTPNKDGMTLPEIALGYELNDIVIAMLDRDPSLVNEVSIFGFSPLELACRLNNQTVALAIIDRMTLDEKQKSVYRAIVEDRLADFKALIDKDDSLLKWVDNNKNGFLHFTCTTLKEEFAVALAERRAQYRLLNSKHESPFSIALSNGLCDVVKTIIENKKSFILETPVKDGMPPLHIASDAGRVEMMELLIKEMPEIVNFKDSMENTPLHLASRSGKLDAVKLLAEKLASLHVMNKDGQRPIDCAEANRHQEVVEYLRSL